MNYSQYTPRREERVVSDGENSHLDIFWELSRLHRELDEAALEKRTKTLCA